GARPNRGTKGRPACPRVGRLTLVVTSGLDRWSPLRIFRSTELGLQVYLTCFLTNLPSSIPPINDPSILSSGLGKGVRTNNPQI
ncbi:MAG: hypothetical protein KAI42_06815, partial [Dehalococcoidales bacterium]|nr:hypothetical protein [Dehalococcoidales bacterium]